MNSRLLRTRDEADRTKRQRSVDTDLLQTSSMQQQNNTSSPARGNSILDSFRRSRHAARPNAQRPRSMMEVPTSNGDRLERPTSPSSIATVPASTAPLETQSRSVDGHWDKVESLIIGSKDSVAQSVSVPENMNQCTAKIPIIYVQLHVY